ncbi:cob(I)yrinic acid a,c-diamide adenosyltransferase [Ampullimonas aquatilis]|uniref:cob(I)yrinic acid a,c-diamide adenosyltransferase n=1 Tax=Ampullimonas aquatilis TaxID=1341549 RepID=UPI003C7066ED
MGNRLTKIVTRTGDDGTTGLGNGQRVRKDALRIQALGDVDELNSYLGLLLCEALPVAVQLILVQIQHELFDLGAELSIPDYRKLQDSQVAALDDAINLFNEQLPALKEFILPGGCRAAALAHVARTICRRAERLVVALAEVEPVSEPARLYLNRLSDLLFVMARYLNQALGDGDVLWQNKNTP